MAKLKKAVPKKPSGTKNENAHVSSSIDELMLAAAASGNSGLETGRYIVTLKDAAGEKALESFNAQGMRMADSRDFKTSAVELESLGDADGLYFDEIGCAVIGGAAAKERSMGVNMELAADSAISVIEPEYFAFALGDSGEFLRGFLKATEVISKEIGGGESRQEEETEETGTLVLGNTWGLTACRVPTSPRSGVGIKVAVLDTGMFLTHPDFVGRPVISQSFIAGQPVMDGNGHGTHCIGTSCGTKVPPGNIQRYGIGWRANIFAGKVLSNAGSGSTATVLAGMNWAIANRCQVISMSLGAQTPVQAAYTAAGQAALNNGCLIIAAAGNNAMQTGAPANSPTIMSVAALNQNLTPANFSDFGKVEIAGPGVGVFSSWLMPQRYNTISGTSMATPHVAGCAALWAETNANLRGMNLWRKLTSTARPLPFPASRVGAGLVQAPQI
jgi:subtilisin family serine protease